MPMDPFFMPMMPFEKEQAERARLARNKANQEEADRRNFDSGYGQSAGVSQAYNQMVANQQAALENSQGIQAGIGGSEVDKMILDSLRKTTGTGLEDALRTQGVDMAAQAGNARGQQLQEQMARRGMSGSDPAAQAAMGQNFAAQQQAAQKAALDAKLGATQAQQGATSQAIGYQSGLNSQRMQAGGATNQALWKPVTARPTFTVNGGEAALAGADAGMQNNVTKAGFSTKPATSPTYEQYLASQKTAKKPWSF